MKKALLSLFIFVLAGFSFPATKVDAKVITDKEGSVIIAKSEIINDDLFIAAQNVQVDGTVNGDVFIGAQAVTISGIINGNVHIGANTVELGGVVKGNVYTGAQNVLVNTSSIGGSLLIGAASARLYKDSIVGGSVLAGVGTLYIDSQIKRSLYAGAGNLTIDDNAKIGKDVYYASGKEKDHTNISKNATIAGSIKKSEIDTSKGQADAEASKQQARTVFSGMKVAMTILSFLGALIVGFLYSKLFTKHFTQTTKLIANSFWKTMAVGFLITITFIPGLFMLLITIIGVPLAGFAILLFILFACLSKIVVGSALGNWISQIGKWKISVYWSFALGLLLIYILKMIPVVGFLVGLMILWIGLGALTIQTFTKSK